MSLLVLTNNTTSININPPETVVLKVGLTPAGAKGLPGEQGEPGIQGNAFEYSDFTPSQLLDLKGDKGNAFVYADFTAAQLANLKGIQGDPVPITTVLGQSTTEAVSQKLLTDTVGNIDTVLDKLNGVVV